MNTNDINNSEKEKPRVVKTKLVYDYIRSQIIEGVYRPGDRIVIDRMAAELRISISPVREAIRQLEADGLIQTIPFCGAVVQLINSNDHEDAHWVLSLLDSGATFLAAAHMTEQDINELENINKEMQQALDDLDFELIGVLNRRFHEKIYERCGNAYLIERLQQVWQRMEQVRKAIYTFIPRRAKDSIKEHAELIQLFREKVTPAELETFARQHKLRALSAVKNRLEKAPGGDFGI